MKPLHVVAAVIRNSKGETLLSKRLPNTVHAGLWEFPGGKRELNEPVFQTLKRELFEELGIKVTNARPLIHVYHEYPENKKIHLDIWQVEGWDGEPFGKENQEIQWITDFSKLTFLEANYPILKAVQLPSIMAITPEPDDDFWYELEKTLETGIQFIQFRAYSLDKQMFCEYAEKILRLSQLYQAKIILNADVKLAEQLGSSAVHLNALRLYSYTERPVNKNTILSVSCHTLDDIRQAHKIDADLILLAAIKPTFSHPDKKALGWCQFAQFTEQSKIPIYALGGMQKKDLPVAWAHGAQGIAGIRGIWQCR
jgi:8-oxo-dGTP diphosphatase